MNHRLWKLKNDFYQVLLDGLKWERLRLERAAERTNRAYAGVINRATGHFRANRGPLALIVGLVLAHGLLFFVALRDYFLALRRW